jgi:MFS family permease
VFFILPFLLVRVHGYSATATGAAYLPFALLVGGLSRWSGGLADRFGPRLPLIVGPLVTAVGFLLFTLPGSGGSYWSAFFPAMVLVGLGMAITIAPLTSTVMSAVDDSETGVASGINNTVARVAALLAVAIFGLIALEVFGHALSAQLAGVQLSPAVRAALTLDLGVVHLPDVATAAERAVVEHAAGQALVASFRWVAVLSALLAALAALAAGLLVEAAPGRVPAAGEAALVSCAHLELVLETSPHTQGCEDCLRLGMRWVHLRMCLTCGHVGCCDSSRGAHATGHFWATGHPIVRSLEPGETWRWCYVDDVAV